MIVKDGICYPDNPAAEPLLSVAGCSVVGNSTLRVRFNSGDVRIVDISPLFEFPALKPLGNPEILRAFSIDHGILNWLDGELDIAPEWLFDHGVPPGIVPDMDPLVSCVAEPGTEYNAHPPAPTPAP